MDRTHDEVLAHIAELEHELRIDDQSKIEDAKLVSVINANGELDDLLTAEDLERLEARGVFLLT